jgi:hypothetical protein
MAFGATDQWRFKWNPMSECSLNYFLMTKHGRMVRNMKSNFGIVAKQILESSGAASKYTVFYKAIENVLNLRQFSDRRPTD